MEYPELLKLNWKLCTIYIRNVWIFRKIEYLELRIVNGKLCTLYMYRMFRLEKKIECPELGKCNKKLCMIYIYGTPGFVEKLNIQKCVYSTENCVQYICTA